MLDFAATTNTAAPFSMSGMQAEASSSARPRSADDSMRKGKKKRPSRNRMMLVKVFYSMSTPQSLSPPPASQQSATSASASHPSPSFLSTLDPSLAAIPSPAPSAASESDRSQQHQQQQGYTSIARLSAPVRVQIVGTVKSPTDQEKVEYGKVTLKTCLSAICISRPELVSDASRDYSVTALDPYESSLLDQMPSGTPFNTSQGLMEGKGMLSWNLAEKREGTTYVNGRVAVSEREKERRRRKRRRLDPLRTELSDTDDSDSDDESVRETLEVWLQLVERPPVTQSEFLVSLRSFAKTQKTQPAMAEKASVAPAVAPRSGDPVKRKRSRDADKPATAPLPSPNPPFAASTPPLSSAAAATASVEQPGLAQLQDPRIRALLAQVIPGMRGSGGAPPAISLDSEQGRALLPAIRTLAQYYGVELPANAGSSSLPSSSSVISSLRDQQPEVPPASSKPVATGRKKAQDEYVPVQPQVDPTDKTNPHDSKGGCSNCRRRKSTLWRECIKNGRRSVVCNACGLYYNRHGTHRKPNERSTSPNRSQTSTTNRTKAGKPLQGRLTATCEADLKKTKAGSKSGSRPGIIPPPSPSKIIGPNRSPGGHFGHRSTTSHTMTSPGRSPGRRRMGNLFGFAATSPVRAGAGAGLRSGYQSDGEGRGNSMSLAADIFGNANRSPSPQKPRHVPTFLLTASPGTALNQILSDTNVDMDDFDVSMSGFGSARSSSRTAKQAATNQESTGDSPFDFFLQSLSSPPKENDPLLTDNFFEGLIDPSLAPTSEHFAHIQSSLGLDGTEQSFDPLSSLRRDFNNRLSSAQLTAPSSPIPSSPCVQPRTSSATPGRKGKAPASCGRPAPTIFDSFIDGTDSNVVHNSLESETPISDSDAWTPASAFADEDRTMTLDAFNAAVGSFSANLTSSADLFKSGALGRGTTGYNLPPHLTATSDVPTTDFDAGSLPPSSPPQLPSDPFPTPSDAGPTPEDTASRHSGTCDGRGKTITTSGSTGALADMPTEEQMQAFMQALGSGNNGGVDATGASTGHDMFA